MSNKTASLTIGLNYTGIGSEAVTAPPISLACLYQAYATSQVDIPDATMSATAFSVDFGSVAAASLMVFVNNGTQEMIVKINGSLAIFNLPMGGAVVVASSTFADSTPVVSATLTTTGTVSGAGTIDCYVFGDGV